ncbi:hypothetical protein [Dactylosporangium sp. CA-092794]|uniref:hypothetical protein n=1 Tax=Dactylosporangium sp. CA-092794 TaxID=3239929 RepID=UPI003D913244
MTHFLLAQLRLRYGHQYLERYTAILPDLRTLFESQGVRLRHSLVTRVGPLYETWNLWEIDDQGHVARAFEGMRQRTEGPKVVAELAAIVESEQVRFVESIPLPA